MATGYTFCKTTGNSYAWDSYATENYTTENQRGCGKLAGQLIRIENISHDG